VIFALCVLVILFTVVLLGLLVFEQNKMMMTMIFHEDKFKIS